ncbi:CAAX protease family protein [Turicibacter sp. GALT-G1]|uniref:CAAX protease family protein n=1 Tax=Turicibacter sp. GALT-G1 TaxID=2951140 RepID=UPI0021D4BACC|nr:CAAX protease family protein [Turicibacter sp. GALT-G1]MCU7206172.1 CAAX protease family protein [Turicibacter sp. GALT-G1]
MGQYEEQVEVVEAEVISDGSQSSEKDYWRKQLKEELRAELREDYHHQLCKGVLSALGKSYNLGMMIAVVVSFSIHHSILWAIIHGLLGWFYVIYKILFGY